MPQIEHIEVAMGNFPKQDKDKKAFSKRCIFIITDEKEYVMEYSIDLLKTLSGYWANNTKVNFTTTEATDQRSIVKKGTENELSYKHVFYGAKEVKEN